MAIVYKSQFISAWLFFDIADHLGLDKEEILTGKNLQMRTIESIRTS